MDSSKRKRKRPVGDDEHRCRLPKPGSSEGDPRVTDDEVEEFFSIVRRVSESKRSPAATGGGNLKAAVTGHPSAADPTWTPAFALEDFMGPDVAQAGGDRSDSAAEERAAAPLFLDLNADLDPEVLAEDTVARFDRATA